MTSEAMITPTTMPTTIHSRAGVSEFDPDLVDEETAEEVLVENVELEVDVEFADEPVP